MAAVRRLLLRDGGGRDNWWLGLQQSSATWLTSGRPRNYSHWVEGEHHAIPDWLYPPMLALVCA